MGKPIRDPFGALCATHKGYMVLNARKPVFGGGGGVVGGVGGRLRTTKAQTILDFCFV